MTLKMSFGLFWIGFEHNIEHKYFFLNKAALQTGGVEFKRNSSLLGKEGPMRNIY